MQAPPMRRFISRVQHFFAKNAQRQKPLKTAVYRLDESLDVAETAYCGFVVPRGTIAGERRALRSGEHRALNFDRYAPLEFVGYIGQEGYDPLTETRRKNVVCAHFVLKEPHMQPRHIYVNKRFHEVFGCVATRYYLQRGNIVLYATDDENAPALGCVCEYMPHIPAQVRKGGE